VLATHKEEKSVCQDTTLFSVVSVLDTSQKNGYNYIVINLSTTYRLYLLRSNLDKTESKVTLLGQQRHEVLLSDAT